MTDIPLPRPDAQTRPFWDGLAEGRVCYQRCEDCATVQFTPRASCQCCHGQRLSWEESSRWGTVMSYTRVHRAPLPAFRDRVPYVIAILDMDEGFRLMVNATPDVADAVDVGRRVRVGTVQAGGMALPIAQELA